MHGRYSHVDAVVHACSDAAKTKLHFSSSYSGTSSYDHTFLDNLYSWAMHALYTLSSKVRATQHLSEA